MRAVDKLKLKSHSIQPAEGSSLQRPIGVVEIDNRRML